jgi:hypothetical protein
MRGNGKRHPGSRGQTFESSGPDGKIRGTAQQVLERYLALARDASSAGDPITAEGYFQHAEHYYRVLQGGEGYGGERGPDWSRRGPAEAVPAVSEEGGGVGNEGVPATAEDADQLS